MKVRHVLVAINSTSVISETILAEPSDGTLIPREDEKKVYNRFHELVESHDHVVWLAYDEDGVHHVEYGPSEAYISTDLQGV